MLMFLFVQVFCVPSILALSCDLISVSLKRFSSCPMDHLWIFRVSNLYLPLAVLLE